MIEACKDCLYYRDCILENPQAAERLTERLYNIFAEGSDCFYKFPKLD